MRLLELNELEMEERVKQEIVDNPALEEGSEYPDHDPTLADINVDEEGKPTETPEQLSLGDYSNEDEIPDYRLGTNNYSPDDAYNHIKQVDFAMQWPLTERLYGLFRYNYSLRGSKPLEVIGGLEYHHDCWIFRAVAQRYTTTSNEEETNFFLQLELSGLGSIGNNPLSELQRNIKGYQTRTSAPMTSAPYDYYE